MPQMAAAPANECFVFPEILRETLDILADLRSQSRRPPAGNGNPDAPLATALCDAERLRILTRLTRIMLWISLEQDFHSGAGGREDFRKTVAALFENTTLQADVAAISAALPATLHRLSERSRNLFARAERLRSC